MSKFKVIAFSGRAGSGKSTLAKYLVQNHGFTLVKFADIIKDMLRVIGLTDYEIEGEGKEKPCYVLGGKTPRLAMQTLGTEWGRMTMFPDIWVEAWYRRANEILQAGGKVVCDDTRFPNEIVAVHNIGGVTIDVIRPESEAIAEKNHISESYELDTDIVLVNNETTTSLYEKLENFL